MNSNYRAATAAAFCVALGYAGAVQSAGVTFIGKGSIAGTALDDSGLRGLLEDGVTRANQIGGLGSAITYSGIDDLFYATPDRGPVDGATSYIDRLYTISIRAKKNGSGGYSIDAALRDTQLLRLEGRRFFTGSAKAFDATGSTDSLRSIPKARAFRIADARCSCPTSMVPIFTNSIFPAESDCAASICQTNC